MSKIFLFSGDGKMFNAKTSSASQAVFSTGIFHLKDKAGNGIAVKGVLEGKHWWISTKILDNKVSLKGWAFSLDPMSQQGKNYLRVSTPDDVELTIHEFEEPKKGA